MFRIWRLFVLFCQAFGMPQYNWIREAYYIPMRSLPPHRSLYTFVLISSAFRIFGILCGGPNRIYFQQFSPFSFWPVLHHFCESDFEYLVYECECANALVFCEHTSEMIVKMGNERSALQTIRCHFQNGYIYIHVRYKVTKF